jgi:hypothetical protein
MKRKLFVLTLVIASTLTLVSCTSGSKMSKGGCHMNQGYIGYGGRR